MHSLGVSCTLTGQGRFEEANMKRGTPLMGEKKGVFSIHLCIDSLLQQKQMATAVPRQCTHRAAVAIWATKGGCTWITCQDCHVECPPAGPVFSKHSLMALVSLDVSNPEAPRCQFK